MLVRGLLLTLVGFLLLQLAVSAGRRSALFRREFWLTFREYSPYRLRRVWPILPGLGGLILLIWGLVLVFEGILAYYAARLGHPLGQLPSRNSPQSNPFA